MNEVFQRRVVVGGERLLKHRHTEVRQQLTARRQPSLCRDSLASTISVASGAARRIAISRSLISRSSSFTFNSWAPACHSARRWPPSDPACQ